MPKPKTINAYHQIFRRQKHMPDICSLPITVINSYTNRLKSVSFLLISVKSI